MSYPPPNFEIHESQVGHALRLRLTGELDLATVPVLEDRLTRLQATSSAVRLDLSELDFIDSTGIDLLVRIAGAARTNGWQLQIEPDLAPNVKRVLALTGVERIVMGCDITLR